MIIKSCFYGLNNIIKLGPRCLSIANQKYMSTKMRYDIKDRVVLITGAASGIGAGISETMLREGVKGITLADIDVELGKKLYCKLIECYGKERVQFVKCDVLCHNEIKDAFDHTVKCFKQLDIVFNNAGIINEMDVCRTVNVNVTGAIVGTQLAIEQYLPKYRSCKEGVVINTASIVGHVGVSFLPTYCSTKHALIGLAKCYGDPCEYQRTQTRVMNLCPGFTTTHLFDLPELRPNHKSVMEEFTKKVKFQSVDVVNSTVVHMLKCGKPGSSWIISNEIMEEANIVDGYNIDCCFA